VAEIDVHHHVGTADARDLELERNGLLEAKAASKAVACLLQKLEMTHLLQLHLLPVVHLLMGSLGTSSSKKNPNRIQGLPVGA
jgi:hypothetical protein